MNHRLITLEGDADKIRKALALHSTKFVREGFSFELRNGAEQTVRLAQTLQNRHPSPLHAHLAASCEELLLRIVQAE